MRFRTTVNMPIDRNRIPSEKPQTTGLSRAWRELSYQQQEEDLAGLVASNFALKGARMEIRTAAGMDNIVGNAALKEAEKQWTANSDILRKNGGTKVLQSLPWHWRYDSETFFDVAEVAEQVITSLEIVDALALQRVNKRTCAINEGSEKVRRKLHLLPESQAVARALAVGSHRSKIFYPRGHGNLKKLNIQIFAATTPTASNWSHLAC